MEELNILDLFKYLKKRIFIIILIALVALTIGTIYTSFFQTPKYKSNTTILLLKSSDSSDAYLNQSDVLMNQKLVTTYTEIIKSNKVLNRVIKELALPISTSELASRISVSSQNESILISITVTSLDKKEAKNIANSVAKVFTEEIQNLLNMQNVGIVDEAVEAKSAYNVKKLQQIIISLLAGLFIGVSVLFVLYYFDTTIKTSEQIENEIGLPVIGIVPEKRRGSKWKRK